MDRKGLARILCRSTDLGVCDGEEKLVGLSFVRTLVNGNREEDLGRRVRFRWGCGLCCGGWLLS